MTEQQLLLNFKKAHLTQNELGKITTLATGIFDVATMTKLLTKLGASLKYYEPDAMVKTISTNMPNLWDGIRIS